MKKQQSMLIKALPLIGILCASAAFAQNVQSFNGCLKSRTGTYVLQGVPGKRDIPLVGKRNFAAYIDHAVLVEGSFAAASNDKNSNDKKESANRQFTVTKLTGLSEACSVDNSANRDLASAGKPSPYHK